MISNLMFFRRGFSAQYSQNILRPNLCMEPPHVGCYFSRQPGQRFLIASLIFAASNGGSDYTTAPAIFISSSGASQPERNGSFSAMHPEQIFVLNNGDIVAVMAPREDNTAAITANAGL